MEFSVGNTLGTSFSVWFRNFVPFTALAVVVHIPLIVLWYLLLGGDFSGTESELLRMVILAIAMQFILGGLLVGTITYGVVMQLRGTRASFMSCLGVGVSRFLPTLLVTILFWLGIFAGALALVIPAVILYCMWFVTLPASIIERPGIGGAFSRSSTLTRGVRGQIFGLALLTVGVHLVINKMMEKSFQVTAGMSRAEILHTLRTYAAVDTALGIVFATFGAVVAAVAYAQLRNTKEGTSAEELARVFD